MVESGKRVVLISASPKIGESTASDALVDLQEGQMQASGLLYERVNVRQCFTKKTTESAFVTMAEADALVITFPLYFFCLPGMLQRFLQDYYQFHLQHHDASKLPRVYAVVNCGFPEASINAEAVRVIKSFS
ncbi:MAG: flavodoxin, partial [Ignavibacteriales bacterium]